MNIIIIILIICIICYFLSPGTEHYTDPNYGLRAPVHVVLDRDGNALETLWQSPRGQYGYFGGGKCGVVSCPEEKYESNNTTCWCCGGYN